MGDTELNVYFPDDRTFWAKLGAGCPAAGYFLSCYGLQFSRLEVIPLHALTLNRTVIVRLEQFPVAQGPMPTRKGQYTTGIPEEPHTTQCLY